MNDELKAKFAAISARFAQARAERAKQVERKDSLAQTITRAKQSYALKSRFLGVTEKMYLDGQIKADELQLHALNDEKYWTPVATVVIGQHQTCACGHVADATVGIFARENHNHFRSAYRLKARTTIPDGLPLERSWTSAQLKRCVMCAETDIVDALVEQIADTQPQLHIDAQLRLWS